MLNVSILSLVKSWKAIPKFKIYSDGTISPGEIKRKLAWLGPAVEVADVESCYDELTLPDEDHFKSFAERHVMGKKLLVILCNARKHPILWSDSDVLWFRDFSRSLHPQLCLKMSRDYQPSYSPAFYDKYSELSAPPYLCAGFLFLAGDLSKKVDLFDMVNVAIERPDHFSEQTIIARAAKLLRSENWSAEEIACFESDKDSLIPDYWSRPWIARHYVGPVRHLFWRDALFLLAGLR